jgi:hypothetical protein
VGDRFVFGSEILDVAVGLILIFLLFSLIMTAVNETIDAILKRRARNLEKALWELLGSQPAQGQSAQGSTPDKAAGALAAFYNHPLIFALYQGGFRPSAAPAGDGSPKRSRIANLVPQASGPSYIPARTFAQAVMALAETTKSLPPDSPAMRAYTLFASSAQGNAERIRAELEGWYDGIMDRASGWYRRQTQWILLIGGFLLAIILNVNAFTLARHLSVDQELTRRMVEIAAGAASQPQGSSGEQAASVEEVRKRLNDLTRDVRDAGLPIGWSDASTAVLTQRLGGGWAANLVALVELLLGYAVVAFAATLGAPFWFDVLNKFMVIRSTVKPREKSREEGSEDRRT